MKKFKYFIFLFVMMFTCLLNAKAVVYGSDEAARAACNADVHSADLSSTTGKVTTRSCVQNFCSTATFTYEYYSIRIVAATGVCANGNRSPYKTVTYGLVRSGSCNGIADKKYTNMDTTYDCSRTADGKTYQKATTTTTTKKNTTQAPKPTAPNPTTKKTGTNGTSVISRESTTTSSRVTTPGESTTSSTTTTTTQVLTSDASIKRITINDKFDLGYSDDKNEYAIKVPYSMVEFNVYVETGDPNASVEISGNNDITSEGGTINIKVTSSDSTNTNEVKINVTRYTKEEGDCSLGQLLIKDYTFDFSPSKEQYTLKLLNNDKSLEIDAVPTNPSSILTINGNEKLKNNSKIEILVEAVDGTTCTYLITTKKSSKLLLYLLIIVIIGVAIFFAVKKLIAYTTKGKNRYRYE